MVTLGRIAGVLGAALIAFSSVRVEALTWTEASQAVEAEDLEAPPVDVLSIRAPNNGAEYDAFAAATGYHPLPLAHESSR